MGYVYIITNKRNGTLYTGVTNSLERRVDEHKYKMNKGFSKKHSLDMLVRYQEFNTIIEAIEFEKRIKGKSRSFKIELIEVNNLYWLNLSKTEGI